MNQRIHELGKLAGAEASKEVVYLNNIYEWQLVFEKKFAELIINECIAAHEDYYGGYIIGDVLKNHFGMK